MKDSNKLRNRKRQTIHGNDLHYLATEIYKSIWGYPRKKKTPISQSASFFVRDGWTIYFSKKELRHYLNVLNWLIKYKPLTKWHTEKMIMAQLQSLTVKLSNRPEGALQTKTALGESIKNWLNELLAAKRTRTSYYFVVQNLRIKRKLIFGGIEFKPMTQSLYRKLERQIEVSLHKNLSKETENIKSSILDWTMPEFVPDSSSALAMVTYLVRDADFGKETALENLKEVISVLQFLQIGKHSFKVSLGIRGEAPEGRTFMLVKTRKGFGMQHSRTSMPLDIFAMRKSMKNRGMRWFSKIVRKKIEERTDLEQRIVNAAMWIGNSTAEQSQKEKFLKLCIALESLLVSDQPPFGSTIAERLAFLLEKEPNYRKTIHRDMIKIYKIRSKIAHEGKPERDSDLIRYLPYANAYANAAVDKIQKLIVRRNWKRIEQLLNYFEEKKFS